MPLTALTAQRQRLLLVLSMGFGIMMGFVALIDAALWAVSGAQEPMRLRDLVIALVTSLAALWAYVVGRKGSYEAGACVLVGALALRTIFTVVIVDPEHFAIISPAYVLVVVVAQVLIGSRAGFITGLASLPMFALTYANLPGRPDVAETVPAAGLANLLLFAAIGGVVHMSLSRTEQALRRANLLLVENERARRELQERGEQFRALAESSPTGIVIQQDGHLVYGNARFAEMARCVQNDIFGLSLWDFFAPQDAAALRAQLVRRRSTQRGPIGPDQLVFRPLKGSPLWCEVVVADAVYRDREAIVANLMDVSERVAAQLEVQRERDFSNNIINAADAIIMALDSEGRIVRLNPAGERITGYKEAELLGLPFWDIVVPTAERQQNIDWLAAIKNGHTRGQVETTWVGRSGEEHTISWRYVAQTGPNGQVTGVIGVGIDVTQQRALERQAMATERLRALGQMAGGVAHDLNNTLTGILGPVELLLSEETDPHKQQELSAIAAAARRGADTVRRIQRFSQARTDLDRQVFNLRELVEDVIYTLRPRWRDAAQRQNISIRITNQVPDDLMVVGSSGEIGNVLTNLIVNACEAMPWGGEITVSGQQEGDTVRFAVSDTGTGMSEETLSSIFQPFFTTKGAENSGLGLAIIRGIILRHGGSIDVKSKLGAGTTFYVSLPAATREPVAKAAAPGEAVRAGALRWIVVDDSRPIADFAGAALRKLGHEAVVFYTGEQALEHLRREPCDVLLTDYGMEGLSGLNLAQKARMLHPHIRTVLMTGWDVSAEDFADIDSTLPKPFTIGQLTELIGKLATGSNGRDSRAA